MGKLLNSDKIVDFIDKHSKAIDENYEKTYTLDDIQEYLDAMLADYDVDSVVAAIKQRSKEYNSGVRLHGKPEEMLTYEAIEIVEEGGAFNE